MARAEDAIRRYSNTLNVAYMDDLIDVPEMPTSNYDFSLVSTINQDDITNIESNDPLNIESPKLKISEGMSLSAKTSSVQRYYYCSECNSSFTNASNLKAHLRTHTGEKPYACDECGMAFVQSSNLKAHKRIHTGERPFKCSECGRQFIRSSHLLQHKRKHTGEEPYSCPICLKSFMTSVLLRKHTQKHGKGDTHVCNVCEKTFDKATALSIHLQIHSDERPFICVSCSAAFRSKEDLNIHKKLHIIEEVYPYACHICQKGFKKRLCCENHMRNCSPIKEPPVKKPRITASKKSISSIFFDASFLPEFQTSLNKTSNGELFQFDEDSGVCKMELLEASIEDGIEHEVDTQMMVFTNGSLQVIPSGRQNTDDVIASTSASSENDDSGSLDFLFD